MDGLRELVLQKDVRKWHRFSEFRVLNVHSQIRYALAGCIDP
jgi:hypothetical protein